MRLVLFFAIPTLALFSLLACQSTDSPEAVVRQWQAHIDKNEFAEAKALSAPRTLELLSWMETLFAEMDSEITVTQTDFEKINCKAKGDKAVCYYTLKEEGQIFRDSFLLVRMNGSWLVDLPEEPFNEEESEEDLEALFEMISQDSIDQ